MSRVVAWSLGLASLLLVTAVCSRCHHPASAVGASDEHSPAASSPTPFGDDAVAVGAVASEGFESGGFELGRETGDSSSEEPAFDCHGRLSERVVGQALYFATDSAVVGEADASLAQDLAALLTSCRQNRLVLVGHTDARSTGDYNLGLSRRRAEAVKNWLVDAGVPADQIEIQALGEGDPAVEDGDSLDQQANRRVDFKVVEG